MAADVVPQLQEQLVEVRLVLARLVEALADEAFFPGSEKRRAYDDARAMVYPKEPQEG